MKIGIAAAATLLSIPLSGAAAPDVAEGRMLVEAGKCETCHGKEVRGPVGAIYVRKNRKVTTWPKLQSQVAQCNTALGIGLFPEDEEHIAVFLDDTYYRLRPR